MAITIEFTLNTISYFFSKEIYGKSLDPKARTLQNVGTFYEQSLILVYIKMIVPAIYTFISIASSSENIFLLIFQTLEPLFS